jgi:hypothetical protein
MKNDHIVELLESKPFGQMSERELMIMNNHVRECPECDRGYKAALLSSALLRARLAEEVEPSPFFKTRVMARIRENSIRPNAFDLGAIWRFARGLVTAMVAAVVILGGANIYSMLGAAPPPTANTLVAEQVLFQDANTSAVKVMDNSEVVATVLGSEDANVDY